MGVLVMAPATCDAGVTDRGVDRDDGVDLLCSDNRPTPAVGGCLVAVADIIDCHSECVSIDDGLTI